MSSSSGCECEDTQVNRKRACIPRCLCIALIDELGLPSHLFTNVYTDADMVHRFVFITTNGAWTDDAIMDELALLE